MRVTTLIMSLLLALLPATAALAGSLNKIQGDTDIQRLEPGKQIERKFAGGDSHSYQISLVSGQYVKAVVLQKGIDLIVKVVAPDGKPVMSIDSPNGNQGPEPIHMVAEASGSYMLKIESFETGAAAGDYELRVIEVRESVKDDRALEESLKLFAESIRLNGEKNFEAAVQAAERALALREKVRPAELHGVGEYLKLVIDTSNNLAAQHNRKGDYAKAEPLYQRSLALREKSLGPDHPDVATSLNNLGVVFYRRGEYAKAEPLYLRSIAIREKALRPDHPDTATSINNLGAVYEAKGDYVKAESLYQRALAIYEGAKAEDSGMAQAISNLALLYSKKGDYAKATTLLQRSLEIRVKALGPEHPAVADSLNTLAVFFHNNGEYVKPEPLYLRSLEIRVKSLGPEHPDVANSLNNLGELYRARGEHAKAEPLLLRALQIRVKAQGEENADVAMLLNNLALLYEEKGEYAKAEPIYQRALAIYEKVLGPEHPNVVTLLGNLAAMYEAKDDLTQAVAFRLKAADISERLIAYNLAAGSEKEKLLYLSTFSGETQRTVSLHVHLAPNDRATLRLALTTILRRKGRALDAMADIFGALRRRLNPEDRALLDQLANTRSRLATLVLGGPARTSLAQHQAEIKRLEEQSEKLEAQISMRSAEFRVQSDPVTLESVQAAIPPGAALVEFVSYYRYDAKKKRSGSQSYVAYVLKNQGEPLWADLGEAEKIDAAVRSFRDALRDPDRADVRPLARAVDEKIMQPVRALLGGARALLISPDGALNLVPFGALVDEQNRYLIEQYSLTYLTTGRDLLRMQTRSALSEGVMVVANPDFGDLTTAGSNRGLEVKKGDAGITQQIVKNPVDFSQVEFGPLPGTADEAKALKTILRGASVLTEKRATEAALKQISRPAILHIATHGFFLEDVAINPSQSSSRGLSIRSDNPGQSIDAGAQTVNPLLRSGLAMTGANQLKSGDDDGVLTASEVAGLNLWGTKLVVLSACDTGVGEVKNGEGVYGLRRALVLAGSESQVMSLWPVSDEGTRDLMIGYYRGLQAGQGRSEALRQVQLSMLRSKNRKHPYYWASFIQSGEWANLAGKR
jgi:CHAT domain-containing protein/Tfp pilus assembly protein PilF